jgi:transcription antitermination factor NusG
MCSVRATFENGGSRIFNAEIQNSMVYFRSLTLNLKLPPWKTGVVLLPLILVVVFRGISVPDSQTEQVDLRGVSSSLYIPGTGALVFMPDRELESVAAIPQGSARKRHPWYAIHVRSKFERIVSTVLQEKGFEEFLPLYRAKRQWSDRVKQLDLPLFPGYVFCRIDLGARLLPVVTTPGVLGIVSAGKYPIAVSDLEIEAVQTVLLSGLPAMPWPGLSAGSPVLIEHGPLAGVEGVVLEVNKKYRLIVSVPLLQRAVAVEIERDWVRPLAQAGRLPGIVPLAYSLRNSPQGRFDPQCGWPALALPRSPGKAPW